MQHALYNVQVPGDRKPEEVYYDVTIVFKQILVSDVKVQANKSLRCEGTGRYKSPVKVQADTSLPRWYKQILVSDMKVQADTSLRCEGTGRYKSQMKRHRQIQVSDMKVHCYKTEGEIPAHTPGDARRQRPTPGKRIRHEAGVYTCTVLGNFTISGNFRIILFLKKSASGARTSNL